VHLLCLFGHVRLLNIPVHSPAPVWAVLGFEVIWTEKQLQRSTMFFIVTCLMTRFRSLMNNLQVGCNI
jgi:hypothetical protein